MLLLTSASDHFDSSEESRAVLKVHQFTAKFALNHIHQSQLRDHTL